MKRALSCLAIGLFAATALAQELSDPIEILKKADAATKAVKAVRYEAAYEGSGWIADRVAQVKGTLTMSGGKDDAPFRLFVDAKVRQPKQTEAKHVQACQTKELCFAIDPSSKTVSKGEGSYALGRDGNTAAGSLQMREFAHPTPFSDEINADKAELQGTETIGGEKCYKIYVQYAQSQGESTWYFSTKDFLPRRVERINRNDAGEQGVQVLTISKLEVDPKIDDATFALNAPEGYEVETVKAPERPKLLAVGTPAPDWTLSTPTGQNVSLRELRGKIVVLDFWAVWCGPCKMAMPHVQAVHEKFAAKGVKVFGVNTWEQEPNDPAKFMKDNNYSYGLLMKGDEVAKAYGVAGIPTFYVIAPDGKIAYTSSGFAPDGGQAIEKVIENLLKDEG